MTRAFGNAFLWLALMLATCELIARLSLPYGDVTTADTAIRNPLGHRAWPEYLDAAGDSRPLAVLISNSQGVGGEIRDADGIYAADLRRHLSGAGWSFENWSTRGLRTAELELLVHRAISRGARHVLVVVTANNFDPAKRVNLRFPFSDIVLLAGAPSLWPGFGDALFMRDTSTEELLSAFAALRSALVRSRVAVIDLAASKTPRALHGFAFGRQVRPGERLDAMADPSLSVYLPAVNLAEDELKRRRDARLADPDSWTVARLPERFETLEQLVPRLGARLEEGRVGVTWVWQPLQPEAGNPETHASIARFIDRARPILEAKGIRDHDLTRSFSARFFATQGHFNEEGHREFARRLTPIVDEEILDRGRTP